MTDIKTFLEQTISHVIFLFGLGKSGMSLLKFLINSTEKIKIFVFDQNISQEKLFIEISNKSLLKNVFINLKENEILENLNIEFSLIKESFFVLSPGIDFENTNHFMVNFVSNHKLKKVCDIELFIILSKKYVEFNLYLDKKIPQAYFIGITGTNGKSTVSALVNYVLKENGFKSFLGGNFGIPIFDLDKIFDEKLQEFSKIFYITEVSSFQIDLLKESEFDLSTIINITSDHLERYEFSEERYAISKEKLISLSKRIILGLNDYRCLKIFIKYFLLARKNDEETIFARKFFGAYYFPYEFNLDQIIDEIIDEYSLVDLNKEELFDQIENLIEKKSFLFNLRNNFVFFDSKNLGVDSIQNANLKGDHNLQNLIIAYVISCIAIENDCEENHKMIVEKLNSFDGLEHRIQLIAKYKNIYFINDSKATSAHACRVSLKCFENVFLILGGIQKIDGLEPILEYFSHVKKVYLIGRAQENFADFFEKHGFNEQFYEKCDVLDVAVRHAFKDALLEFKKFEDLYLEGDFQDNLPELNILFSPACSSFDQFENFEHRGEKFIEIVHEILKEKRKY